MKVKFLIIFLFKCLSLLSQSILDLNQAIDLAMMNSDFRYKADKEFSLSKLNNESFQKKFLPNIFISSIMPSVSKSVTRITTPEGSDIFVNQDQAYYDLRLTIEQDEPILGGSFQFSTFLNRIDLFGASNNKTYYSTPFSIGYTNNMFLFKTLKKERKINQLRRKEEEIIYSTQLEEIAVKVVNQYFTVLIAERKIKNETEVLEDYKKILGIAQERFKIGSVSKGDLLSLKLNILSIKSSIIELRSFRNNSLVLLGSYIDSDSSSIELKMPSDSLQNVLIQYESALKNLKENNKLILELDRKKMENEIQLKQVKSNSLSVDINASFGLSNTGSSFSQSIGNLQNQQLYSFGVRYLISSFGKRKNKISKLKVEKELIENDYELKNEELENELNIILGSFKNTQKKLSILKQKLEISSDRYDFLKKRFLLGKTTISDLNLSQKENRQYEDEYLENLKEMWNAYYNLRKMTLFDYIKKKKIIY